MGASMGSDTGEMTVCGGAPSAGNESQTSVQAAGKTTKAAVPIDHTAQMLGMWRIGLFMLMCTQWVWHLPQYPIDAVESPDRAAVDRMFAYDQFEWLLETLPTTMDGVVRNNMAGFTLGMMAAAGLAYPLSAPLFTAMFARQFFFTTCFFTNHDYLFFLLMTITSFSGANAAYSLDALFRSNAPAVFRGAQVLVTEEETKAAEETRYRRRRTAIVMLRAQLTIVYLFASLWKVNRDWVDGHIVRSIFLTFEEQGVARGVPWHFLEQLIGCEILWPVVAAGGLVLDSSMFLTLSLVRPRPTTSAAFATLCLCFHGFTFVTMSPRIGNAFPATCMCAIIIFLPMNTYASKEDSRDESTAIDNRLPAQNDSAVDHGDASLISWLRHFASSSATTHCTSRIQRVCVLGWVIIQLCIPLRMPLNSGGDFPLTAQGYRFSWTMMLHSKAHTILIPLPLELQNQTDTLARQPQMFSQLLLFNLVPVVTQDAGVPPISTSQLVDELAAGTPIPRTHYMPGIQSTTPQQPNLHVAKQDSINSLYILYRL